MAASHTDLQIRSPFSLTPNSVFLPAEAYTSPEFYDAEMRSVFPSSWFLAADLAYVAKPGDFVTKMIGYEPVLIVRDDDNELHVFANICPHRGTVIMKGSGNCESRMVCPYHGWSYNPDGTLRAIPNQRGFDDQFDRDQMRLRPLRFDIWERFVFVNVDGSAPPLLDYLEAAPSLLAGHNIAALSPTVSIDDTIDVNWKVFVDNALDDYHIPIVHADTLQPFHEGMEFREDIGDRYVNVLVAPMNDYGLSIFPYQEGMGEEQSRVTYAIDVFPNVTILAFPDGGITTLQLLPLAIDRTAVELRSYSHRPDEIGPEEEKFSIDFLTEDYRVMHRVQQALRSRHFQPGPAHYREGRTAAFHRSLLTVMG